MAGAALPLPSSATAGEEWVVEFSRFFNFPRRSFSSPPTPGIRPLPRCKLRASGGTWISAASSAILRLRRPGPAAVPVLSVSVRGVVHEEHFVSNLHYSWPQVSCDCQFPTRGSRVVFMSFRDCSSQIEKFAVRFPTCADAETFFTSVKECSRDTMDIGHSGHDFACESSSPSELIASNGLHYRCEEEASYEESVATCGPGVPSLTYDDTQSDGLLQPSLANNIESISPAGFPPSFTELLTNCSNDTEKGGQLSFDQSSRMEEADLPTDNAEYLLDSSCHANASAQAQLMDEDELKTQISKYMSDASFHEMLFKIEKVIDELGGDLAL